MSEIAVILNAIAAILWPICILLIAYIFRIEIRESLIARKLLKKHYENDETPVKTILKAGENILSDIYNIVNEISVSKNIRTGNYFIVLEDYDNEEMLLVTPLCEAKRLRKNLFTGIEQKDIAELLRDNLLTPGQIRIYNEYINGKEEETEITAQRPSDGNEPEYIRSYRNMLSNPHTMPSIMLRLIKENSEIKWVDLIEKLTEFGYVGTGGSLGASLRVLYIDGYIDVHGIGDYKTVIYNHRNTA